MGKESARGRLLLTSTVLCWVAMPFVAFVGCVAPMGDPLPGDPDANTNPGWWLGVSLLAAALLLLILGAVALVVRERSLRAPGRRSKEKHEP